jgi:SAM-dependent methyltransferase
MTRYVFDPTWAREAERLGLLASYCDDESKAALIQLGLTSGWRCADVGAGRGSISRWLAQVVAPSGHVEAIDIDPRYLADAASPTLSVRKLDVLRDDLGRERFDLAHARFILVHLDRPEAAVAAMVRAVRPGGWVVATESDYASWQACTPSEVFHRVHEAYLAHGRDAGWDLTFGSRLPKLLRDAGLEDVEGKAFLRHEVGGSVGPRLVALSIMALSARLLDGGGVTRGDLDAVDAMLHDPSFAMTYVTTWTVWGRRPSL